MADNHKTAEWHEHPDARALLLCAKPEHLPGLPDATRRVLDNARATCKRERILRVAFPDDVLCMVTIREPDSRGEMLRAPGVGRRTMEHVEKALAALGLRFGMRWSETDDWARYWTPGCVACRAAGVKV